MDDEERRKLRSLMTERMLEPGEVVMKAGEPGTAFYIIEQGEVEIWLTDTDGKKVVLEILGPGKFFGELSMLSGETRSASATSDEELVTLELDRNEFFDFLRRRPDAALDVLKADLDYQVNKRVHITFISPLEGERDMTMTITSFLTHLLTTYGYWAVFIFVALEGTCIPFPGETMLLIAAIYAGTTHHLLISLVIVAAASGAIVGDNLGFWIGRTGGFRLLRRYGHSIGLKERTLKLGQYLFRHYGEKVVFFGCFVTVLRAWTAFLAGTNRMPWERFLLFNMLGSILWAILYGAGGYLLGNTVNQLTGPIGIIGVVLGLLILLAFLLFVRPYEQRLEDEAERALPGPLADDQLGGRRDEHPAESLTTHGR